jgi:hypothetical protein
MIQELVWIGTGVTAAWSTYWIHTRFRVNPVMASSLVTLAFALGVSSLGHSQEWVQQIPYAAIGGSFIGMSTKKTMKGLETVLLASLIFGVIFTRSSHFFEGFGGALGISACIAVLTAVTWRKFAKRTRYRLRRALSRSEK